MLSQQASANATEKLINVLEATLAKLKIHAEPEHRFRFVSAAQSRPLTLFGCFSAANVRNLCAIARAT